MKYSRHQDSYIFQSCFDGLFVYLWFGRLGKASHKRANSYYKYQCFSKLMQALLT